MRKSERLRFRDLRRAHRLIHDCRDVAHDAAAWPVVLADGLIRLADAEVVVVGEVCFGPTPTSALVADRGWSSPGVRAFWKREYFQKGMWNQAPTFLRFAALEGDLITRSRDQLIGDAEWKASEERLEYHRAMELDEIMASNARSGHPPIVRTFFLARALGRPRFGAASRRLVRIFHRELTFYVSPILAREAEAPLAQLPPRLRQTLACLMEGDSEKQVAARLRLSRHTVHEYVTLLYRRLGVGSRAELMALGLRHRFRDDPVERRE
jgi:DNA-binding CsgD family transcriptional regulator